jgi:hypothetical protein
MSSTTVTPMTSNALRDPLVDAIGGTLSGIIEIVLTDRLLQE